MTRLEAHRLTTDGLTTDGLNTEGLSNRRRTGSLERQLKGGLSAPICLTWELTYACNLACVHCLSSSGRRDPAELSTKEVFAVIDELSALSVFYVNIGGGEPMLRRDFEDILDYATQSNLGVKFSTNGYFIDPAAARRFAENDMVDIQISLDGIDPNTNDLVRGAGSWKAARTAMDNLAEAGFEGFKISIVATRYNVDQLGHFKALADQYRAQLRVTRLRPAGRGIDSYRRLRLRDEQQRQIFRWILEHPDVLTGDSFFHLNPLGEPTGQTLPGLNMCGAGRIVCLIDPIGDVYACPFVMHDDFKAGNVREPGGFSDIWRTSELFLSLREPNSAGACASCGSYDSCGGGCMAAKFFTAMPLDGPDPDCVLGSADDRVVTVGKSGSVPRPTQDHSKSGVATGLVAGAELRPIDQAKDDLTPIRNEASGPLNSSGHGSPGRSMKVSLMQPGQSMNVSLMKKPDKREAVDLKNVSRDICGD